MKRFELTENSIKWKGYTLYQIKALQTFTTNGGVSVSEGELGGWVEKEENLSQEGKSWIWDEVKVCGTARVAGNAEIWSNATICGNAKVYGNAKIYGSAKIYDNAKILGYSEISGNAKVVGNAYITGNAKVFDNTIICDNAIIRDNAYIAGNAIVWDSAEIFDSAKIYGEVKIGGNAKIGEDAEISSPEDLLTVTPVGKYKMPITFFKTKNDLIKISYNWEIYTLEKFDSVMSDWIEKEKKVVKAAIELAKLQIKI